MAATKGTGGLTQQLSLSARPKTLDGLFGQARLVKGIRGHFASGRYPKAFLFTGPSGTGKTTTAKILGVSYQCRHQERERFGQPCLACRRNRSLFPIYEINAADATTTVALREALQGVDYGVMGGMGRYRVYILDECFPADTPVDIVTEAGAEASKCIADVEIGDRVRNAMGSGIVYGKTKKEIKDVVCITAGNREIITSRNHPFFTSRGWVAAAALCNGDRLISSKEAVRILQEDYSDASYVSEGAVLQQSLLWEVSYDSTDAMFGMRRAGTAQTTAGVLFPSVSASGVVGNRYKALSGLRQAYRAAVSFTTKTGNLLYAHLRRDAQSTHSKILHCVLDSISSRQQECTVLQLPLCSAGPFGAFSCESVVSGTYAQAQSDEQCKDAAKDEAIYAREEVCRAGRERMSYDPSAGTALSGFGTRMARRVFGIAGAAYAGVSDALHNRPSKSSKDGGHRSGWAQSSDVGGASQGRQENEEVEDIRVDTVAFLESDDSRLDKYRDAEGKLYFYDLAVTRHPSFSVQGCLVHNCHQLSDHAQNRLLKFLEETPKTTVFILCSTAPHKLLPTVRNRCFTYEFREMTVAGMEKYVQHLLNKVGSKLPADRLVDALVDAEITGHRLIANAVEKYVAGLTPEESAQVQAGLSVESLAVIRAVIRGEWADTAKLLFRLQGADARGVRFSLIGYLRKILLEEPELSTRAEAVAKALSVLCSMQNAEDLVISGALAAELYRLCGIFSRYKR